MEAQCLLSAALIGGKKREKMSEGLGDAARFVLWKQNLFRGRRYWYLVPTTRLSSVLSEVTAFGITGNSR